jgi:hypothetical protein
MNVSINRYTIERMPDFEGVVGKKWNKPIFYQVFLVFIIPINYSHFFEISV